MPRIGSPHHVLGVERSAKHSTVKRRKSNKIVRHGPPHHSARSVWANCPCESNNNYPELHNQNFGLRGSLGSVPQATRRPRTAGHSKTHRTWQTFMVGRHGQLLVSLWVCPMINSSVSPTSSVKLSLQSRSQRTNGPSWECCADTKTSAHRIL